MKSKSILFAALLAALLVFLAPRQSEARVSFSYFYESLAPYGEWVDVDTYGYCWVPRGMAPDWRPYTDGYWSYTDAGWTWVSYEDFGSVTYHYGRWVRMEEIGWVWRPDYEWGPAWVSWRQSDDYIGWAPLPPEVEFNPDSGIGVWVDRDYDIGPSAYVFCEYRYFGAPVIRNVILPVRRNYLILNSTVNITNISIIGGHDPRHRLVYNGGPDYRRMSQLSERRIERLELVRQTEGDWLRQRRPELSRQVGSRLFINAPEIEQPKQRIAPPKVWKEFRAPQVDKGWSGLPDPKERERIHQRYREQTEGLTRQTAPAYRMNAADIQRVIQEPLQAQPTPQFTPSREQRSKKGMSQPQQVIPQSTPQPRVAPQQVAPLQQVAPQTVVPVQPSPSPSAAPQQRQRPQAPQIAPQAVQTPQAPQVAPQQQATPAIQKEQEKPRRHQKGEQPSQGPEANTQIQLQQQAEQQRKAAEATAQAQRQQQEQLQRQQQAEQQRKAAETNSQAQRQQQEQLQRQQQAEQQRKAAEATAQVQRQQQELLQRQQQAEQQRKAAEATAQVQRQQQEQLQRQQQAEQQRKAAEANVRAQRQQQEQLQRQQQQAEQRQAAEANARVQRQQQEQAQRPQPQVQRAPAQAQPQQGQASPTPDDDRKKKHRD